LQIDRSLVAHVRSGVDGREAAAGIGRSISIRPQHHWRSRRRPQSCSQASNCEELRAEGSVRIHSERSPRRECLQIRLRSRRSGQCRAVPQPSASTASATISSTPEGSVASAAASAVQPPASASASTRRSRASITATSTSSRCTPTRRSSCQRWPSSQSHVGCAHACVCPSVRAPSDARISLASKCA
jgi:hypothetical protein